MSTRSCASAQPTVRKRGRTPPEKEKRIPVDEASRPHELEDFGRDDTDALVLECDPEVREPSFVEGGSDRRLSRVRSLWFEWERTDRLTKLHQIAQLALASDERFAQQNLVALLVPALLRRARRSTRLVENERVEVAAVRIDPAGFQGTLGVVPEQDDLRRGSVRVGSRQRRTARADPAQSPHLPKLFHRTGGERQHPPSGLRIDDASAIRRRVPRGRESLELTRDRRQRLGEVDHRPCESGDRDVRRPLVQDETGVAFGRADPGSEIDQLRGRGQQPFPASAEHGGRRAVDGEQQRSTEVARRLEMLDVGGVGPVDDEPRGWNARRRPAVLRHAIEQAAHPALLHRDAHRIDLRRRRLRCRRGRGHPRDEDSDQETSAERDRVSGHHR